MLRTCCFITNFLNNQRQTNHYVSHIMWNSSSQFLCVLILEMLIWLLMNSEIEIPTILWLKFIDLDFWKLSFHIRLKFSTWSWPLKHIENRTQWIFQQKLDYIAEYCTKCSAFTIKVAANDIHQVKPGPKPKVFSSAEYDCAKHVSKLSACRFFTSSLLNGHTVQD